jgi:hypothetical protein
MLSTALNQKGATTKPKTSVFGNVSGGLIGNLTNKLGFSNQQQAPQSAPQAPATQSSSKWAYTNPNYGGQSIQQGQPLAITNVKKTTVDTAGNTTTTHPAQANPSVLEQQKMLNQKYGAGLVEDGLAGPKTSAAIAKYLSGSNSPSTTPQATTQTAEPKPKPPATFPGLINNLADQSSSPFNQSAMSSIKSLQDVSKENPGTSGQAYTDYQSAVDDLNKLQASIAQQTGGIESQPISMQFQQGKKQALERQNAALIEAAQARVEEKASALGYGIQGVQTQQSGFNQAGNLATTGQGLAQNALGTAAGLAAPQLGSIGQVPFNPLNQQQGSVLGSQGGGLGQAGQLLGQFQGAQSTASDQFQQTEQYKSALQQGQNLQSQFTDLISSFGLNPSDINVVNAGIQKIAQNTSSPEYQMLQNYVNDIANTYAQILTPPGGSATDTTRSIALSMLNATASGQSLITVMQGLDEAAKAKIAGVNTNNTGTSGGSTGGSGFAETW